MDVANHNVPAECGSTMFAIARDVKTGLFDGFPLLEKSEMTNKLKVLIENIRKKFGHDHSHLLFSELHMGNAGEQSDVNKFFQLRHEQTLDQNKLAERIRSQAFPIIFPSLLGEGW
jgi:hypothetical protein